MTVIKTINTTIYKDPKIYNRDYSMVSNYRHEKIDRFKFESDRFLSLGAGKLLHNALSDCGFEEEKLTLSLSQYGKPCIEEIKNRFSFSLSHSGEIAMIAYSYSPDCSVPELGCDIEFMKKPDLNIVKRFFSESECNLIFSLTDEDAEVDMFYRIWVLHESFMKATGRGLSVSSKDFSIDLSQNGEINVINNVDDKSYIFREIDVPDGYKAALCEEKI